MDTLLKVAVIAGFIVVSVVGTYVKQHERRSGKEQERRDGLHQPHPAVLMAIVVIIMAAMIYLA